MKRSFALAPAATARRSSALRSPLARRSAASRPSSMARDSSLLLVRVEEGHLADLVEVHADGITHCEVK